jgi:hypothetical protein
MSTLLEQASLVMIPSGYKEDVVYSQIPTSGAGDLSFTRASNGTRINSAGLVEVCPWNLIEQSETFDNASWVKGNLSVTANSTTAPNGTTTADTLTTTSVGQCNLIQNLGYNVGVFTMSIYVKKVDSPFMYVEMGSAYVWFNLTTGASSGGSQYSSDWAFISATSESVGNGWLRLQMVAQCLTAGTYGFRPFQPVSSSGNYNPSAIGEVTYLWGAQLNIGSTAKPYFPTTDRLNVPRLTYQNGGGGCPSLLLEKQSTNLNLYSEDFSNAVYTLDGITVTANATTSPDGTQNADKLVANAVSGDKFAYQVITTSLGSAYTASAYFKASEYTYAFMRLGAIIGDPYIIYNLATQAVVSTSGLTSYSITSVGNGWYRITATATATTVVVAPNFMIIPSSGYTLGGDNIPEFTGNGSNGGFIWGAQLEQSSYPTSYIPTTSSSATRVADACFKTGISSLIGQSEGVVFADFIWEGSTTGGADYPISIYGSSYSDFVGLNTYENTNSMYVYVGGSNVVAISGTTFVNGQRYKIAMAYKLNDFVYYLNGTQMGTDTSGGVPSSMANFQTVTPFAGKSTSQKFNEIILFKTRLTNAELASLTTI